MVIPTVLKLFEISFLEGGEGGVGEWLDRERGKERKNVTKKNYNHRLTIKGRRW